MQRVAYVVDDDPSVARSLVALLQVHGVDAAHFPSAEAFIQAVPSLAPGCVLMDVRMPGMDGVQALEHLLKRRPSWPIILMTGHPDHQIASAGLKLGAIDLLEKPFSDDDLWTCLHQGFQLLDAPS